jgi:hypothetical protein
VPALVLGGGDWNHAALQDDSALGLVRSQGVAVGAGHGVAPDSFEGPTPLVAANAGVLETDVDVFVGAHEGDPGWGALL